MNNTILLTIDEDALARYEEYYFSIHTKAKKKPIKSPYHESINVWIKSTIVSLLADLT